MGYRDSSNHFAWNAWNAWNYASWFNWDRLRCYTLTPLQDVEVTEIPSRDEGIAKANQRENYV